MLKTIVTCAAVLALAAGLQAADPPKKITIGIVAKSQSNPVFQAAHAGARDAAKELGPKYGVEVTIDIQTPPDENAQKQAEAVEQLGRAGVAGIAVSCSDANTVSGAIDKAVAAGATVMCFDSDAPKSKRFCYYGTDDITCGKMVLDELAKAMGNKGTIAILAGNQAAPNLRMRVQGVKDGLKKYPNMKLLEDGVFYHVETPEKAAEAVNTAQTTNPSIEGWAMIGGWPLFTKNALKWKAGENKVVAVDALPAQLPYLESGHVQILLAQDCYGWGYKSVEILLDKIIKNQDPKDAPRVIDPLTRVVKDNAGDPNAVPAKEWAKKWEKWLAK